ncbi:MAG: DNA-processing protein DprA [Clostridiales bacterium]|nr:DNA-processing protein DprA [Clostridiales bacterium]
MTDDKNVYWIWLQSCLGTGARVDEILSVFPSPEDIFDFSETELRISGVFTARQLDRLKNTSPDRFSDVPYRCRTNGWEIITPDDDDYPPLLLGIRDYPLVLFSWGDLSCVRDKATIAVVGSRSASVKSVDIAGKLCDELARAGAVVVSGCALGVDSAAHTGALHGKGKTVAVLGCGLNVPYLRQNEALRNAISKNGAVITEYLPDTEAKASNFPARNRIISGLSKGVLVVEAGVRSGSLITAGYAAEQGRDLYAVPGDITDVDFTGVNKLIRDGAKPVFSVDDILCEYPECFGYDYDKLERLSADGNFRASDTVNVKPQPKLSSEVISPKATNNNRVTKASNAVNEEADRDRDVKKTEKAEKRQLPNYISEEAIKIYEVLGNEPLGTDDIARKTKFNTNMILTALTELEIYGFIKMLEGKRYIIV